MGRHRGSIGGDSILEIAVFIIDVMEYIDDIYKEIAEDTIFSMNYEFTPVPTGFRHPET